MNHLRVEGTNKQFGNYRVYENISIKTCLLLIENYIDPIRIYLNDEIVSLEELKLIAMLEQ